MRFDTHIPCPNGCRNDTGECAEFECMMNGEGPQVVDCEVETSLSGRTITVESVKVLTIEVRKRCDEETIAMLEREAEDHYMDDGELYEDPYVTYGVSRSDFVRV